MTNTEIQSSGEAAGAKKAEKGAVPPLQEILWEIFLGMFSAELAAQLQGRLGVAGAVLLMGAIFGVVVFGLKTVRGLRAGPFRLRPPWAMILIYAGMMGLVYLSAHASRTSTLETFDSAAEVNACWSLRDPATGQRINQTLAVSAAFGRAEGNVLRIDANLVVSGTGDHRTQLIYWKPSNLKACSALKLAQSDQVSIWLYVPPNPINPLKPDDLEAEFFVQAPGFPWIASSPITRLRPGQWVRLTWDKSDPSFGAWNKVGIDNFGLEIKTNLGYMGPIYVDMLAVERHPLDRLFE